MGTSDGFHPDLAADFDESAGELTRSRVHHVKAADISSDTAQSEGMRRFAALTGRSVGSQKLWMGETAVSPNTLSANPHHGESETAHICTQRASGVRLPRRRGRGAHLRRPRRLHLRPAVSAAP